MPQIGEAAGHGNAADLGVEGVGDRRAVVGGSKGGDEAQREQVRCRQPPGARPPAPVRAHVEGENHGGDDHALRSRQGRKAGGERGQARSSACQGRQRMWRNSLRKKTRLAY